MLDLYQRIFGRAYHLEVEIDPHRAARRLESEVALDGVLCDLMMGPPGGLDLYRIAMLHRPELASHFIFVTGGSLDANIERALEQTGRRIVSKPFTIAQIVDEVAELVAEADVAAGALEATVDCPSWREVYRIASQGQRGMLLMPADPSSLVSRESVKLALRVRGECIVFEGRVSSATKDGDGHVLAYVELSIPKAVRLRLANALLAESCPSDRHAPPMARGTGDGRSPPRHLLPEGVMLRPKR